MIMNDKMDTKDVYDYNEYADREEEEIQKEMMAKAFASLKLENMKDAETYNEYADRREEEIQKEMMAKAFASLKLKNNEL